MEEWFLNYKPDDIKNRKIEKDKDKKIKRKTINKKNKKSLAIYGGKTRRKY